MAHLFENIKHLISIEFYVQLNVTFVTIYSRKYVPEYPISYSVSEASNIFHPFQP